MRVRAVCYAGFLNYKSFREKNDCGPHGPGLGHSQYNAVMIKELLALLCPCTCINNTCLYVLLYPWTPVNIFTIVCISSRNVCLIIKDIVCCQWLLGLRSSNAIARSVVFVFRPRFSNHPSPPVLVLHRKGFAVKLANYHMRYNIWLDFQSRACWQTVHILARWWKTIILWVKITTFSFVPVVTQWRITCHIAQVT